MMNAKEGLMRRFSICSPFSPAIVVALLVASPAQAVLDGDLDGFIEASLKMGL